MNHPNRGQGEGEFNNYLVVYVEAIDRSVTQFELFDPYDSTDKTLDTSSL